MKEILDCYSVLFKAEKNIIEANHCFQRDHHYSCEQNFQENNESINRFPSVIWVLYSKSWGCNGTSISTKSNRYRVFNTLVLKSTKPIQSAIFTKPSGYFSHTRPEDLKSKNVHVLRLKPNIKIVWNKYLPTHTITDEVIIPHILLLPSNRMGWMGDLFSSPRKCIHWSKLCRKFRWQTPRFSFWANRTLLRRGL